MQLSRLMSVQDGKTSPPLRNLSSPAPTDASQNTIVKASTPAPSSDKVSSNSMHALRASVTKGLLQRIASAQFDPIDTSVPPAASERLTPRAQTRQEAEQESKRRSRASSSLEGSLYCRKSALFAVLTRTTDIPENDDGTPKDDATGGDTIDMFSTTMDAALREINNAEQEIETLQTALTECWTLCNTLAGLSSIHRERMFNFSGKGEMQEHAWRTCWKLCQRLYENRNEDHASQVRPTLELCRDFCQALFEVRQRGDEVSDSVLRVSFELNNHLYNTHDRNLPEPFRERTLDFYLTLCHRLMKQRTSLPEETDSLLRACWNLAEMLFSLRQNNRENKPPDEELLGSAVQACWELCDLFREGWTQVRPDRGTPRPSVTTFAASLGASSRSASVSSHSSNSQYRPPPSVPETPTTIYDDREEMSPEEPTPNILVLGPEGVRTQTHTRWSSNSSNLSTYSETSQRTSSTATAGREDPHLSKLKTLIVRAAMNIGYSRNMPQTLPAFVKALPSNSFGTAPWQLKLLESYRKLVIADPTLRAQAQLPSKRFTAAEVARAVQWMGRSEQFAWLRDLYRLVFGFFPDDAVTRKNVTIST